MHTHMLFSRSYTLLCALETGHTPYTIYFALIHHCTNSLSSLHIFVHHCTFCASLHTKTSPGTSCFKRVMSISCRRHVNIHKGGSVSCGQRVWEGVKNLDHFVDVING